MVSFLPCLTLRASPPVSGWRQVAWAGRQTCNLLGEINIALVPGHLGSIWNGQEQQKVLGNPPSGGTMKAEEYYQAEALPFLFFLLFFLFLFIHLKSSAFAMCCKLKALLIPAAVQDFSFFVFLIQCEPCLSARFTFLTWFCFFTLLG